jgi:hypothetical protein
MLFSALKAAASTEVCGSSNSTSDIQGFNLDKGADEQWLNRGTIETTQTLPEAAARATRMTTRRRAAQVVAAVKKATAARLLAVQQVSLPEARPAAAARARAVKLAALVKEPVQAVVKVAVRAAAHARKAAALV